jgi:type II secretory pathway pseudopilin PulG
MKPNAIQTSAGFESHCKRDHAFTLTELLVVIGAMAMLGILILPALARSDDNGARMVCMNNLRQMGMAVNMYAGDNRDYLAYPNWDGGEAINGADVPGWLYTVTGGTIPNPNRLPWKNNPISAWQTGLWFQYVQNPKSYLCPVDIESPTYTNNQRQNELSSYVMNGAVAGFPAPPIYRTCKVTDAWSPACWLLWEPNENANGLGNPGAFEFNDGAVYPNTSEGIGVLHTVNAGNLLCVGGNVQIITVQTFKNQSNVFEGVKSLAWWSPFTAVGH